MTQSNFYTLYTEYNHLNGNKRAEKFLELCKYCYKSSGLALLNCILNKELKDDTTYHTKNIIRASIIARC